MIKFILISLIFITQYCLAQNKTSKTNTRYGNLNNFFNKPLIEEDKSILKTCLNKKQSKKADKKLFSYLKNKFDPNDNLNCKEIYNYYKNSKYLTISNISLDNFRLLASMQQIKFLTLKNLTIKDPSALLKLNNLYILTLKNIEIKEDFLEKLRKQSQQEIRIYKTK